MKMPIYWLKTFKLGFTSMFHKPSNSYSFSWQNSINFLFYESKIIKTELISRSSTAKSIAKKNKLAEFWITPLTLSIYVRYKYLVPLILSPVTIISVLLFLKDDIYDYRSAIILLVLFSNFSFMITFLNMNYQILGWVFIPLSMFFISNRQEFLAVVMILLSLYVAITPGFLCFPIFVYMSDYNFLIFVPYIVVSLITIYRIVCNRKRTSPLKAIRSIASLIGLYKFKSKYKRKSALRDKTFLYQIILLSMFIGQARIDNKHQLIIPLLSSVITILNETGFRVADWENIFILNMISMIFLILNNDFDIFLSIILYLYLNPPSNAFGIPVTKVGQYRKYKLVGPFNYDLSVNNTISLLHRLESPKILFLYSDPKGHYEKLFQGYGYLVSLFSYCAAKCSIQILPDWDYVASEASKEFPSLWISTIGDLNTNCELFNFNYVFVFANNEFSEIMASNDNFQFINSFEVSELIGFKTPSELSSTVVKIYRHVVVS
jgi:hypothetical protein